MSRDGELKIIHETSVSLYTYKYLLLKIEYPYTIPKIQDNYSSLFWSICAIIIYQCLADLV